MNAAESVDRSAEEGMAHVQSASFDEKKSYQPPDDVVAPDYKAGSIEVDEKEVEVDHLPDPFVPFDNLPEERDRVLTIRAVIMGCICGALVNASNVYLGLKTGWTFTANLFGAILGFAVIKFFSVTFAENFPILGGGFGPKENNIIQTAATASGGLSNVFVSAYPALYQLNLMSEKPSSDFWKIVSLTAVGGYFGFFFATPLRKFFIVHVARELSLVFPTATATAMTIRSMHEAVSGELIAKMKTKALAWSFTAAFLLRVVSQYAVGILWDWHIFTWFFIWGGYNNLAINVENWGWLIEFTPAFIGSGMLVGLNVAFSFYGGSILAWGIIGPALVHNGAAFGVAASDDPKWDGYVSFASLSLSASNKDTPSPRYWMLWPGVLCMIAVSFTELALQWRVFVYGFRAIYRGCCGAIYAMGRAAGKELGYFHERSEQELKDIVEDPALPSERVKTWMWLPGLVVTIIATCVVMGVEFDMPVGMSVLSVFLAFFFSFLAIQCTGVTDITPLTAASKASQIVLGGATKGEGWGVAHAQKLNLLGGALANMGANQSTDLTADFRVGFLLRTPPIQQWIAQGLGTIVAVFLAPGMFVLFATAYPCILDTEAEHCAFSGPSVSAWRAVAIAVTDPAFPIPTSSGIFAICFSIFGVAMVLVRHFVWVGKLEWVRAYHPNIMCVSLAFVLPQTVYGLAMIMGALPAYIWAKRNPKSFDIYGYAIAAGLIAGEGIGGVVNAIFQIAGISGDFYGSNIACPGDLC
ncbi:Oligopeptide transporter [Lasiodiplodia theobromae]|uniref:Oligopeptide transporter n=1 Tax=Lasiodiplodia theobromae TaxID=45133 RepID=UPI0015C331B2|nr:Oligopeptide transporter [Lasiodiplodia theobromae]KAF4540019.1 Oligopeptide transporter [Lasiodiplodia theobromae]